MDKTLMLSLLLGIVGLIGSSYSLGLSVGAHAQTSGDHGGLMHQDELERIVKEVHVVYELAKDGSCKELALHECAHLAGANVYSWPWIVRLERTQTEGR